MEVPGHERPCLKQKPPNKPENLYHDYPLTSTRVLGCCAFVNWHARAHTQLGEVKEGVHTVRLRDEGHSAAVSSLIAQQKSLQVQDGLCSQKESKREFIEFFLPLFYKFRNI